MQIKKIVHVRDCLDKSVIKEVFLTEQITQETVRLLGEETRLQLFMNFPRPFYKINLENKFEIKGVLGESGMRVRLLSASDFGLENMQEWISLRLHSPAGC